MKNLYDIYEGIFDDDYEEDLDGKVFRELLGEESQWVVCKDKKHIRMDDRPISSLPQIEGETIVARLSRTSPFTIKNVKAVAKSGLEFLPLCYFNVRLPGDEDLLNKIPCPWTAHAYISWDWSSKLDFTSIRIECKSISIMGTHHTPENVPAGNLIAPKYHIDYLDVGPGWNESTRFSPEAFKNWDCDILFIRYSKGWVKPIGQRSYHDDMQDFYPEIVQELVDNNPKVKQIYIGGCWGDPFAYRCSCKTVKGKRQVVKMIPLKLETLEKRMQNYTSWMSKSLDAHHEYEMKDKR